MMIRVFLFVLALAGLTALISPHTIDTASEPELTAETIRIGTYDNRAIAIAYAASRYNPVSERMQLYQSAKAEGDEKKMKELEAWGAAHQRQLHRQGFSKVPVDDLLEHVKDKLPQVAAATSVKAIVWNCDFKSEDVETVDVTMQIVKLFEPSEKALKNIQQIRDQPPVDLDEIEKMNRQEGLNQK